MTQKYKGLANFENSSWKNSTVGKEFHRLGYYCALDKHPEWHIAQVAAGKAQPIRPKCKLPCNLCNIRPEKLFDEEDPFPTALTPVSILSRDRSGQEIVSTLLDTGAGANFMKPGLAKKLKLKTMC
jgi:hypothetical protein